MAYKWQCVYCDGEMFSASGSINEKYVECIYCNKSIINPHYCKAIKSMQYYQGRIKQLQVKGG